jgi:hypothetical protein
MDRGIGWKIGRGDVLVEADEVATANKEGIPLIGGVPALLENEVA